LKHLRAVSCFLSKQGLVGLASGPPCLPWEGPMSEIRRLAIVYDDGMPGSKPALIDLDELSRAMRPERYAELVSDLDMACKDALAHRGAQEAPATMERIK